MAGDCGGREATPVREAMLEGEATLEREASAAARAAVAGAAPVTLTAAGGARVQRAPARRSQLRPRAEPAGGGGPTAPVAAMDGGGRQLPHPVRRRMEDALGADFVDVRLHTGSQADDAARRHGARAFTYGTDIVFAHGEYAPQLTAGRELLAHELVHVVQQRAGEPRVQRQPAAGTAATDPAADEAEQDFIVEETNAAEEADRAASPQERARVLRFALLLTMTRPEHFTDSSEVVALMDRCRRLADDEDATLKAAARAEQATEQDVLDSAGEEFPNTWADKIDRELHYYAERDIKPLRETLSSRRADALTTAKSIPPDLWDRGFNLKLDEALNISKDELERLVLGTRRPRGTVGEASELYLQAMLRWIQAAGNLGLVDDYEGTVTANAVKVRRGEVAMTASLWASFQKDRDEYRRRLEAYRSRDVKPTLREATRELSVTGGSYLYLLPLDGVDEFWAQVATVDARIVATGFNDCLSRAFTWAFQRDFLQTAGRQVWDEIKANGWKALFTAVALLGVQFVPGVDVAVDVALLVEFGFGALSALADLERGIEDAGRAKSVLDMEHASAQLAQVMVGTAADIMIWAITWGLGKIGTKAIERYKRGQRFIDQHGDSIETRRALGDARGDIEAAEGKLAAARKPAGTAPDEPKVLKPPEPPPAAKPADARATRPSHPEIKPVDAGADRGAPAAKPVAKELATQASKRDPAVSETKTPDPGATDPAAPKPGSPPPTQQSGQQAATPPPAQASGRTLANIEKDLAKQGISSEDVRRMTGGKRASAELGARVQRLLEHFTPEDVKALARFLARYKRELDDDAVAALINDVPRGDLAEVLEVLDEAVERGRATGGGQLSEAELEQIEGVTVHEGRPPTTTQETPPSTALGRNLAARHGEPPPGYHAHHIVPDRAFGSRFDWIRKRLRAASRGINSADNGVFLAGSRSTANPELTRLHNSYVHAGTTKEYAYTLTRRLGDLHGEAFVDEVRRIADEMTGGTFKIDEIPYGFKTKWQPGMTVVEEGFEPGWLEE